MPCGYAGVAQNRLIGEGLLRYGRLAETSAQILCDTEDKCVPSWIQIST
jgi:hypothetical protein